MPPKIEPSPRSLPRVQFLAIAQDIFELREQGYSLKSIYKAYRDKDLCCMHYQTLCRLVRTKFPSISKKLSSGQLQKNKIIEPRQDILNELSPTASNGPQVISLAKEKEVQRKFSTGVLIRE
jgi:hypothetical protein